MISPLAPVVHGPVMTSSSHVLVSNALAGAEVRVLVSGDVVGRAFTASNGDLWIPLDERLTAGTSMVAEQEVGGTTSPRSNQPVPVVPVPDPLPLPTFASPVSECMNTVLLTGLVPGATVTLRAGNTVLTIVAARGTAAYASFDPTPLSEGVTLTAGQACDGRASPTATSPPLASVSQREHLSRPQVNEPVTACETVVLVSNLIPAGELEIDDGSGVQHWPIPAVSFWATGARPFQEGELEARQTLPGCGGRSDVTRVPVGPATTPPAPVMMPFCPEVRRVLIGGLKAGAQLTLWYRENGQATEVEIGSVGVGAATAEVDLPQVVGGQGPIMEIVARQTLCGLTSPPSAVLEFNRPGPGFAPPRQPRIRGPLRACMRAVPAEDLFTGVLVHAFSQRHGVPLSDPVLLSSPTGRVPTWFPLAGGDEVVLRQQGCSAPASSEPEHVQPLPAGLPAPGVVEPLRPGQQSVTVKGCWPGARLHLLVDWNEVTSTDQAWDGEVTLQLPAALADEQRVWAVQTLCSRTSPREGRAALVTRGRLEVTVAPDSAAGGKAMSTTVTAADTDTGQPVTGLVVHLGGVQGVTGAAFGWTPPTSSASVSGVVRGGVAYKDAGFTVPLRQAVPLTLNLFPGPVVHPHQAWQTGVSWTVTPNWGAPALTVAGNVGTAMVPPPPSPGARVSVRVALTAHLQGLIGGIVWPEDQIPIDGYLADVALTKPSHALSARFWYRTVDVYTTDDDGTVTGSETKLAAGVQLFSIT